MKAFGNIASCNLAEIDRRFRGTYYHQRVDTAVMMETVRNSETSVYFYETTRSHISRKLSSSLTLVCITITSQIGECRVMHTHVVGVVNRTMGSRNYVQKLRSCLSPPITALCAFSTVLVLKLSTSFTTNIVCCRETASVNYK
jgi:hypothetical protein